jgi:hypothetical protein
VDAYVGLEEEDLALEGLDDTGEIDDDRALIPAGPEAMQLPVIAEPARHL